jgi:hypothetical protein
VFVLGNPILLDLRYEGKASLERLAQANTPVYFSRPSVTNEKV